MATVDLQVKRHGGAAVWGWLILHWSGLYIEALYHCVWKNPRGELIDLSEKYPCDSADYSTFVADQTVPIKIDAPSRFLILSDRPEVGNLLRASQAESHIRSAFADKWRLNNIHPEEDELIVLMELRRRVERCIDHCVRLSSIGIARDITILQRTDS